MSRFREERVVVSGRSVIRRTYSTPVGSVYEDEYRELGVGQWHANRSWTGNSPWITDRLIKTLDDYKVVKYIVEHTEYCRRLLPHPAGHGVARRGGPGVGRPSPFAHANAHGQLGGQRAGAVLLSLRRRSGRGGGSLPGDLQEP